MSNIRINKPLKISEMLKALSNPNRLKIFLRLINCCPPGKVTCRSYNMSACVGEVSKDLGIVPSTVSHHIKELRQSGLVNVRRRGQNIECRIDSKTLNELTSFFESLSLRNEGV
jgi:ArsR family transcriptional regulator